MVDERVLIKERTKSDKDATTSTSAVSLESTSSMARPASVVRINASIAISTKIRTQGYDMSKNTTTAVLSRRHSSSRGLLQERAISLAAASTFVRKLARSHATTAPGLCTTI